MSNPLIDKAALARRFLALGAAEQRRFLELLQAKGIRFELLPRQARCAMSAFNLPT